MIIRSLLAVLFLVTGPHVNAAILFAPVFGHNLVLQRDAPVPVWGTAAPGEEVTVHFAGQTKAAQADVSGRWRVTLAPLTCSASPRTLSAVTGYHNVSTDHNPFCTNVVIGEVWIAAGQSNMEWPLAKEMHAAHEMPTATNAMIRLLNLPFAGQYFFGRPFGSNELARMTPEEFFCGNWQPCSPASAKDFSAIGYYFGRELQQELNVPVGIIHLSVGGSPTEAWIRRAALAGETDLQAITSGNWLTNSALDSWCRQRGVENLGAAIKSGLRVQGDDLGPNHHFKPGFLWDAGPARLLPYAVRGVLWYQGESNSLEPWRVAQHGKLFPLLVRDWRMQWAQARMPFFYCQLSSISTNGGYKSSCWPDFRDQQRRFLDLIPDTGMAVTSDLGSPIDVHPRNKRDIARRLAAAAFANVYGLNKESSGPLIEKGVHIREEIVLHFRHAQGLRTSDGMPPNGFEVAGADAIFHPAAARIQGEKIVLSCANMPAPNQVRYAWQPFPIPTQNLVNASNLPASTFRVLVNR